MLTHTKHLCLVFIVAGQYKARGKKRAHKRFRKLKIGITTEAVSVSMVVI
jgi:hypothetical protein